MKRAPAHAGSVHLYAVMLSGLPGADLLFHLRIESQAHHLLSLPGMKKAPVFNR
jgi:hypothetical protein